MAAPPPHDRTKALRPAADIFIATGRVENCVALMHNDRDFAPMEKALGLVGWR